MKASFLPTFAAVTALAASGTFAQNQAATQGKASIRALSESDLKEQTTVSAMLGKKVVDQNDDTIGTLRDIDFSNAFGETAVSSGPISLMVAAEGSSDTTGDLIAIEAESVTFDRTQDRLVVTLPTAGEAPADTPPAASGGVSVSASSNSDASTTTSQTAPPQVAAADPANTLPPVAVAAVPGSDIEVATTGDEVLAIERALADNQQTRDVAKQVDVMSSNEAILLTGRVGSDEQRRRVIEVAKEAAQDREVRDLLDVAAE